MSDSQRPESQGRQSGFRRAFGSGGGGGRPFEGGGGGDRDRGFRRSYGGPPGPAVDYRGLVEWIARSVADKPELVEVNALERGHGTVALKVRMADEDVGRLIGKAGRNIEAIRNLVRVASLRERKRVFVDLANTR